MSDIYSKYEAVIGLEIHAQLATNSKAFSNDANLYGEAPNTLVSAISLGHPGTLPRLNKKSVEYAIRLGLACESDITEVNKFARKNYFYGDLPKGYQITQFDTPICQNGRVIITVDGEDKPVGLTRIHMEEDTGKSLHDMDPFNALIDLNRAGVPLVEIVSEPDMRSGEEAYQFVSEMRKLVRYLDICDGNMEEGSLRCDANISVRLRGAEKFGTKVEVKNMNSMRNVQRAIDFEIKRQVDLIESGEQISQETRTFQATDGSTLSMRSKEEANDYRYFTEPDLQRLIVTENDVRAIRAELPALPRELFSKYCSEYGLNEYDAGLLTESKEIAAYFEAIIEHTKEYKAASNWVMGEVKSYLNNQAITLDRFPLAPSQIAEIIQLIQEGKLSHSAASQKLFPAFINKPDANAASLAEELDLIQQSDDDSILQFIDEVIKRNPDEVERYRNGEKKLAGFFMGQLMKISKGKADPKKSNQLMRTKLEG